MAIVVDTCSLVMVAKNYLPLDNDGSMVDFIKQSFVNKELLLLDIICDEAKKSIQRNSSGKNAISG